MIRFTLRQIEFAVAVGDLGSVAAAAQALGVAQPSVSAAVMKLESQLGIQLFIRQHAQGVRPTSQGVRFLADARHLLNHARDFQREAEAAGADVEGDITIGSFHTLAPVYAPRLISAFQRLHPKTRIRLEEGTQDELYAGLRSGRYDLGLLYKIDPPGDLRFVDLISLDPYVLLPRNHRFARQRSVALSSLAEEPFILLDISPSRTYFTGLLEAQGIRPRIAFSSPSLELVRGLVGQGLGYSLLITRPEGDRSYDGEALAVRPIAGPVAQGVISLAILKQMRPTRLVSTFETFCVSFFSSLEFHRP
jgi:DNA-binding transcriptional LysR family regulator